MALDSLFIEKLVKVTSKAALVGLTKAISMEFLEKGVTCNCVVPGFIEDFDSKEKALSGHWLRHPQTPSLALKRFGNPIRKLLTNGKLTIAFVYNPSAEGYSGLKTNSFNELQPS